MREFYLNQREFYSFYSFFFSKTEQNIKRIKRRTKVDIGQKSTGREHKIECFVDNLEYRPLDNDLGYPRKGDKFKMLGQQN